MCKTSRGLNTFECIVSDWGWKSELLNRGEQGIAWVSGVSDLLGLSATPGIVLM